MNEQLKKNLYFDVSKPARYIGGEFNQPDFDKPDAYKTCICFPDVYEIGMSNLGIRILYSIINSKPSAVMERCFAPWIDLADKLKSTGTPLLSLESATPLREFDFLGFSLQYELSYSNVLLMFDLSGIPFFAKDRGDEYPIIMAGGPCMANPEPIAEFFDLMMVGEGEESLSALVDLLADCKKKGMKKSEILPLTKRIEGVIVPSLDYPIVENGKIVGFSGTAKKAVVKDFDKVDYPLYPLLPNVEAVHDRAVLELYRGCANGCRYCQAGFYYRPIRSKSPKTVIEQGKCLMRNCGFEEMSLSSLSTGDYKGLTEVLEALSAEAEKTHTHLALPSLRVDSFRSYFASEARRTSLTFAPEAGTQRLRDVINKNITEEDIYNTITTAFSMGYASVKLYFMTGLPTETDEDILAIAEMCKKMVGLYKEFRTTEKALRISVSVNTFIPKPVTPFQWEPLISYDEIVRRQKLLREALRIKGVSYSWNDPELSIMEAVFSRGDRRLAKVVARAYELGCRFDGWTEHFRYDSWMQAFKDCGVDYNEFLCAKNPEELLPNDYIDMGVKKEYFLKERALAYEGKCTKSCKNGCTGCGASALGRCNQ